MNALIVFPSILIFWFFIIRVHSGLLSLLQQFAHVMILESELRVPVTQGLLLGRSEVRKVVILILQSFLIQAKCGEASGCISSGKDPIWPLRPIELAAFGHVEHLAVDGHEYARVLDAVEASQLGRGEVAPLKAGQRGRLVVVAVAAGGRLVPAHDLVQQEDAEAEQQQVERRRENLVQQPALQLARFGARRHHFLGSHDRRSKGWAGLGKAPELEAFSTLSES